MTIGFSSKIEDHNGIVKFEGGLFVCPPDAEYENLTEKYIHHDKEIVVYSALVSRYKYDGSRGTVIVCNPASRQQSFTKGECVNPGGDTFKGDQTYIFATLPDFHKLVRPPFPDADTCVAAMKSAGGEPNSWFWVFAPYVRGEGKPGKTLHFRSDAFAFAIRAPLAQ
jgi:hypothetical protein